MFSSTRTFIALAYMAFALAAWAASGITVQGGWSPPAPSSTAVAYFTAHSTSDDAILSASSDCCEAVELHEHTMDNGVMRMRRVERVALPAGKDVQFAPHGLHVMLIGMKHPVALGGTIPLTLHFAKAPAQRIGITVAKESPATSPTH